MTSRTELFDIGRIVRPHGVRGEVKVEPSTQFPDRFLEMESVIVRPPNREPRRYQIAQARHQNNFVLLKLVDIDSMEAAEALRGSDLLVTREELVSLPPGHYYIFDLIGLKVVTVDGRELGTVKDVLQPGANDVYVVQSPTEAAREILLPAIKDVVKEIDVESGRMVVQLLPGLFDDEE